MSDQNQSLLYTAHGEVDLTADCADEWQWDSVFLSASSAKSAVQTAFVLA